MTRDSHRYSVLAVGLLMLVLFGSPAWSAPIRPMLLMDGNNSFPCDGVWRWVSTTPIHSHVVRAYLFASMNPNGVNGLDAVIWSPAYGGWGALADVHLMVKSPSQAIQGQGERSFLPDSVPVTDVRVGLICWGGGTALVYAEIFIREAP